MNQFPSDIKFKYPWRNYQERVLSELEAHLDDNHLHIIAPPGSGKTILGLEVALRLNKPTLIFAPSIAIRNQWIQRFCEMFLQVKEKPDWISRNIKDPKFLTVVTYQSLHAACSEDAPDEELEESEEEENEAEEESNSDAIDVIELLAAQNIGTIVVDEAHHLKNAWWQSLIDVKNALQPTVVGLTATPPYDSSYAEWQRYIDLNGPVDAEISVPELVVEGDLCPHQDYVHFSLPTQEESEKINTHHEGIQTLFHEIKQDETLIQAIENHPIFQNPEAELDWIYTNLEYYSASLIFLNAAGKAITPYHLAVIGDRKIKIPALNYEWMEVLLTFYLYKDPDNFGRYADHQKKLIYKLRRGGAMESRSVKLAHSNTVNKYLSSSISKLKSIEEIVDFEHDHLKSDLRMVVLTDYIRKEFLVRESTNNMALNKIGVMPIFEQLRRTNSRSMKIGVLTGSLIIIPVSALDYLQELSAGYGIDRLNVSPLPYDEDYVVLNSNEQLKHDIVRIITQVFQSGHIEVLIGTKSLLGEGWDAPSINSLILASFVGSYVLSNQMRGRAIRTQRQNIDKTGNVWHLVCLDPSSPDGGDDMTLLKRRFKSFVGVSFREDASIENGMDRLGLPEYIDSQYSVSRINEQMLAFAGKRDLLKEKWHEALKGGTILIEEIKVPFPQDEDYKTLKSLYYNRTIKNLFAMLGSGLGAFTLEVLQGIVRSARNIKRIEDIINMLLIAGGLAVVLFGRLTYKAFKTFVKYRDISKDIQQVGEALLESLINSGAIHTSKLELTVVSAVDHRGAIYCHLEGGTTYEKSTFIKSLQEIIGRVENPRYVIIRKSMFLKVISQKDYHAVPELIGRKKAFATDFERQWNRFVGSCELVFTRTIEGRTLLLRSRMHSLASEFEDKTERINKWR